jgi:anti-sigma B factor antagonist
VVDRVRTVVMMRGGEAMAPTQTNPNDCGDVGHDTVVVSLAGELDMAREDELPAMLMALAPRPGTTVKLDLRDVSFVDTRGLYSIMQADSYLKTRHCQLRLARPQPQLVRVIELTGLADVLIVADSENPD